MLEGYVKNKYQHYLVIPLAKKLLFLHPNHITFIALFIGAAAAYLGATGYPYSAVFLLFLSGYFDSLDGVLARLTNTTSQFGSALDIVCDRIVEFLIILSLFLIAPLDRGFGALLMLGSVYICVTSFLVTGIFTPNTSNKGFHYSPGLIERLESFLFFAFMFLMPNYFLWLALVYSSLVSWTTLSRMTKFFTRRLAI